MKKNTDTEPLSAREADRYKDPNETLSHKISRYWEYYKIPIIVVICLVIVFAIMTKTLMGKEKVDLYIFFVTEDDSVYSASDGDYTAYINRMREFFSGYISDYNGDGKLRVDVDVIYIGTDTLYDEYVEANKERVKTALMAGTCMCVIGDTTGYEYLASIDKLQDISYLTDDTAFDGKAYCLNDSPAAVSGLGLEEDSPLYIGLRIYYGTIAELQEKPTFYFENAERMIKTLSDPTFNPETDVIPTPEVVE